MINTAFAKKAPEKSDKGLMLCCLGRVALYGQVQQLRCCICCILKKKRKGIIIKVKNQKREKKKPKKQASNFPTGTGFLASTQSLAEALVNMLKVTCFLAIPR